MNETSFITANISKKANHITSAEKNNTKKTKAHRKMNEDWQRIEFTGKYRKAVAKCIGMNTTDKIAAEVLDGILLNLNERNSDKSPTEQKRLLRRIVEKRQSQAMHRSGYCRDRKSRFAITTNTSKCMERLQLLRFAS